MRIELLNIGDELLDGTIVDTNSTWLADALHGKGLSIARATRLPDRLDVIADELRAIAARADVCITTGGLGPTTDDLTVDALAVAAGAELRFDEAVWQQIVALYGER
ncbi:MAG: damage-inducible protein CinA, partial [Myxococcales bacterium]|nr:damage-inducible protein CinA [Myxococcales bacterium]